MSIIFSLPFQYLFSQDIIAGFDQNFKPAAKKDFLNYLPRLSEKASPDSLAEKLNTANEVAGAYIYILEANNTIKYSTNKFYLTGMQFSYKERAQLLDTFQGENISFFGESVKVYNFTGLAVDYASSSKPYSKFFHQSSLIDFYNNYLRGTLLVKSGGIAVLKVLNHLIYGYPLNLNVTYDANLDKLAQFQMSWVINKHTLDMPGIVSKNNLKQMYLNLGKDENVHYNFINDFLEKTDNLLILKNWAILENNNDLYNVVNKLGIHTLNALTFSMLGYLEPNEKDLFLNTLKKYFQNYVSFIKSYIKENDDEEEIAGTSILLKKWFWRKDYFDKFLESAIDLGDEKKFEEFKLKLDVIIKVKEELLILKSRVL